MPDNSVMKWRVLVVDDEPEVRALLTTLIDLDERFTVVGSASDGSQAVELAERERPDAVVLDLMMPELDGWAALPLINERLPDARIVVFSAFPDPLTLVDLLELGADAYLDKATAWRELVPVLAGLCSEPRRHGTGAA